MNRRGYSLLDNQGRVIESGVVNPTSGNALRLESVRLTYDSRGRPASTAIGSGDRERRTTLSYYTSGYLETVTDPLNRTVRFGYDNAGRMTTQTLANNEVIRFAYDANGNLTSLTPPGKSAHTFTYTAVDQVATYTPPAVTGIADPSTRYQYNRDQQLTRITRPDGGTLDYTYDTAGRLSALRIPTDRTYRYTYNTQGKLSQIVAPGNTTLTYTYDEALPKQVAWSGSVTGSVNYGYDNNLRLDSLTLNTNDVVTYQYNDDSLLIKAGDLTLSYDQNNGLLMRTDLGTSRETFNYNTFGEVVATETRYQNNLAFLVQYERDALGRITKKRESTDNTRFDEYTYTYDTLGQLIEVKRDGIMTASYTYDSNGNRLSKATRTGTFTGTYDAQDRLLTYGENRYTYTANGELLTKRQGTQTTQYQYDALGNLRQVTLPDGRRIEYWVDGQNRRVGKRINGQLVQGFLYQDQLKPLAELDSTGRVVSRFVYATGVNVPDYMVKGGKTYRIITDHLGSPRFVMDMSSGTYAQVITYDEFGNVLSDSNPGFQPFGFAGGLSDRDTGLVRFGARDYDPESGRWTVKDPIGFGGGDGNLYSYALNNPISWVDVNGLVTTKTYLEASAHGGLGGLFGLGIVADSGGQMGIIICGGAGVGLGASFAKNPIPMPGADFSSEHLTPGFHLYATVVSSAQAALGAGLQLSANLGTIESCPVRGLDGGGIAGVIGRAIGGIGGVRDWWGSLVDSFSLGIQSGLALEARLDVKGCVIIVDPF